MAPLPEAGVFEEYAKPFLYRCLCLGRLVGTAFVGAKAQHRTWPAPSPRPGAAKAGGHPESRMRPPPPPATHAQSAKNLAFCSRPSAANRWQNSHLAWFLTRTFCPNVWILFSSSMHQSVQQHRPCMAVADVFASLICIWQISAPDAIVISSVAIMTESNRVPGRWLEQQLLMQRFEVVLLTIDSVK